MLKYPNVAITVKPNLTQKDETVQEIVDILKKAGASIVVDREKMNDISCIRMLRDMKEATAIDAIIVIGGDGTILRSVRELPDFSIPILSVNKGTVGFLAELTMEEAPKMLPFLLNGEGRLEERSILSVVVMREGVELMHSFALNEAAISQGAIARLLDLRTTINGEPLTTFHADGLIVATPTGSTAYSLAAGGPVVHPSLSALILTPINPHSLTQKPIVISGDCVIESTVLMKDDAYHNSMVSLTLDGQVYVELKRNDVIKMTKHTETIKFIRRKEETFYSTLRTKLKWGERI